MESPSWRSAKGLEFESALESDSAPLHSLVADMLAAGKEIHAMRDPTRGGLSSALNELAARANVGIEIDERAIPVREEVKGACEMLGLDPLYVANEGKLVALVAPGAEDRVLATMRQHPLGKDATIIGIVTTAHPRLVTMRTRVGPSRVVDMLAGDQLPRIC
jgi:hydrogenase expression/formation protein HypE